MVFNDKEYCEALKQNFTAEFPEGTFAKKFIFVIEKLESVKE